MAREHEKWLNWECQPPTRKTKIFEWINDFKDSHLYRRPVPSNLFEDMFESYYPLQRCYDPFCNEWDLCEEFNPISGGGYDNSDDDYDNENFQELGPGDIKVQEHISNI